MVILYPNRKIFPLKSSAVYRMQHYEAYIIPYGFLAEHIIAKLSTYVTGYWKTDHNVTLGQLHFIGPANSHTHALSMH